MSDTVKTRILAFINYKGMKMKAFEDRCNLSSGYITSMRKGFGSEKLNNVLTAFPELNREWLLYGEGEMLKSSVINHNVVHGNANNSIVEERRWAPVIPQSYTHMPDFDIMGHITKQMTGGDIEKLYSGTANVDVWHYITDDALEPYYRRGDCLGLKAYEKDDLRIIPGELYAVDTKRDGLIVRILYNTDSGDLLAKCTNKPAYDDFIIPRTDVIRIFKKVLRFSY